MFLFPLLFLQLKRKTEVFDTKSNGKYLEMWYWVNLRPSLTNDLGKMHIGWEDFVVNCQLLINECSLRNTPLNYEWASDPKGNSNSLFDRSLICCFLSRDWWIVVLNYFLIFALPVKSWLSCFNNICWEEGVREEKKGEGGRKWGFPHSENLVTPLLLTVR